MICSSIRSLLLAEQSKDGGDSYLPSFLLHSSASIRMSEFAADSVSHDGESLIINWLIHFSISMLVTKQLKQTHLDMFISNLKLRKDSS